MKTSEDPVKKYPRPEVQCYHGGQSYRYCPNFKCDFSVTTNLSGPPASAIAAAKASFTDLEHYPEQDAWVPRCHMADMLGIQPTQIRIGNGASEFIDILSRVYEPGTTWRTGPYKSQYKEFERACTNAGLVKVDKDDANAQLTIVVNPNSPSGDFIDIGELRAWIQRDTKSTFVVDESFLICYGRDWLKHSAISLLDEFKNRVIIITSWTKVLACPLIRLGSIISTEENINRIAKLQAPWSVNGFAQAFLVGALHQPSYFEEMWITTPLWKAEMHTLLKELRVKPNEKSPLWVPYVFCDFLTPEIAILAEKLAFDNGLPVRRCDDTGEPEHLRFGVQKLMYFHELIGVFKKSEKLMALISEANGPSENTE